jgi:hypothetical protein
MSISNEQLLAFVKKNPIGVGCGVLSLLLAVGIYFRSDSLPAAQAILDQKSTEADRHAINLRYAVQLKEQMDAVNAAEHAIDARLVRAAQLATNTQYFYRLETETGIKLVGITQSTTTAQALAKAGKANYVPIAFNMTAQGNFLQLLDVLHRLENGVHFCRVLNASVVKIGGGDSDVLTLTLSLELLGQR